MNNCPECGCELDKQSIFIYAPEINKDCLTLFCCEECAINYFEKEYKYEEVK